MITYLILTISILSSIYIFNKPYELYKYSFNPYEIDRKKEYYRWLTHGFIHADYNHLIFNMLTLYFFGPLIEHQFKVKFGGDLGAIIYILFYLSSILVSSIYSFIKHRHNYQYNSIGASGAVSALVFSYVIFEPFGEICLYFALCIPTLIFAILYLVYSYVMAKKNIDNIGHDAHFYGAIYGFIFTAILFPDLVQKMINFFG